MNLIPQEYADLLTLWGEGKFSPAEIVAHAGNRQLPPKKFWHRMREPLFVACRLRERMIARQRTNRDPVTGAPKPFTFRGLRVNAAFRPEGGAQRSAHKVNEALDLDLLTKDVEEAEASGISLKRIYAEESVRLWCERGAELDIGLGHYGARGSKATFRCHVDTTGCRSWQHSNGIVRPSSVIVIAKELGLALPTDMHDPRDEDT